MATTVSAFQGFRPEAVQFLVELAANNDRAWFQPRKADFERLLKQPLEALCVALDERFKARGIPLSADPARSPFRIYRDTRFAKDKSPYKTNVGASFRWAEPTGGTDPGGYFHLEPGEAFAGGGMWHPERTQLVAWRDMIARDSGRVHAALDDPAFVTEFGKVNGDRLSRVPPGYPADHPDAELLKLKDVTFGRRLSDAEVESPELPDLLVATYAKAVPVMRLLAGLSA
jgi:uncharacterized protein (TIGR02453 family)